MMSNRVVLGIAVGAGYVLGRTKKAKLAFGIGTLVMGKKLQLSPRALTEFAKTQLQNNPQFKELGDQLRGDLQGVGKAATGALVTRQMNGLADRLHNRTLGVQDHISGVKKNLPDVPGFKDEDDEQADEADAEETDEEREPRQEDQEDQEEEREPEKKRPAPRRTQKTASASSGSATAAKKTARSTAKQATTGRTPARKTAAKKTTAKKAAPRGGRNNG
jgi:hypothetical protein